MLPDSEVFTQMQGIVGPRANVKLQNELLVWNVSENAGNGEGGLHIDGHWIGSYETRLLHKPLDPSTIPNSRMTLESPMTRIRHWHTRTTIWRSPHLRLDEDWGE